MRELYKRFVKTWIRFVNPWIHFVNPRIWFVSWSQILTPKRFISFRDWRIQLHRFANNDSQVQSLKIQFVDSICRLIFKRFNLFSGIQWILTNHDESLVHRRTLNKPKSMQILGFRFANPYCFQKICFMDSFCPTVFKRFVLWIWFVDLFLKDLFCGFVLWKQKSQITRFILFQKDLYTIPASLILMQCFFLTGFRETWSRGMKPVKPVKYTML